VATRSAATSSALGVSFASPPLSGSEDDHSERRPLPPPPPLLLPLPLLAAAHRASRGVAVVEIDRRRPAAIGTPLAAERRSAAAADRRAPTQCRPRVSDERATSAVVDAVSGAAAIASDRTRHMASLHTQRSEIELKSRESTEKIRMTSWSPQLLKEAPLTLGDRSIIICFVSSLSGRSHRRSAMPRFCAPDPDGFDEAPSMVFEWPAVKPVRSDAFLCAVLTHAFVCLIVHCGVCRSAGEGAERAAMSQQTTAAALPSAPVPAAGSGGGGGGGDVPDFTAGQQSKGADATATAAAAAAAGGKRRSVEMKNPSNATATEPKAETAGAGGSGSGAGAMSAAAAAAAADVNKSVIPLQPTAEEEKTFPAGWLLRCSSHLIPPPVSLLTPRMCCAVRFTGFAYDDRTPDLTRAPLPFQLKSDYCRLK
jgi:hypothetical protein